MHRLAQRVRRELLHALRVPGTTLLEHLDPRQWRRARKVRALRLRARLGSFGFHGFRLSVVRSQQGVRRRPRVEWREHARPLRPVYNLPHAFHARAHGETPPVGDASIARHLDAILCD